MPVAVAEAVAAGVAGFTRTGRFSVVWHGGEPLAAGRDHLAALFAPFGADVEHLVVAHSLQSHLDDLILRLEQGKVVYSPERSAWIDTSNGKELGSCGRWYQPY